MELFFKKAFAVLYTTSSIADLDDVMNLYFLSEFTTPDLIERKLKCIIRFPNSVSI